MNYYLRKNGAVTGPMSQQDFLARLASGEWSATDEMSTDGKVWTRLGITGFARSIREARFASSPRLGPVVGDLTGPKVAPAPQPSDESQKLPENASFPATPQPVYRRSSPAKKVLPVLGVLLVAALAALAWFLRKAPEAAESSSNANNGTSEDLPADAPNAAVAFPAMDGIDAPSDADRAALEAEAAPVVAAFAAPAAPAARQSEAVAGEARLGRLPAEFAETAMRDAASDDGGRSARAIRTAGNPDELFRRADSGEEPAKNVVSLSDPLVKKAIHTYVSPSAESQELLLINILKSEHVRRKFSDVAASTRFEYLLDNDLVNADSSVGTDPDGSSFGRIRLYGGLVRMARIMGAVLCFGEPSRSQDETVQLGFLLDLGSALRKSGNKCSLDTMQSVLDRNGVDPEGFTSLVRRSGAEKVANAIVESVLAHEFGHLAKGHLNGGDANHQISQIEEQEADLFASTIAASVPEGPEVFAGQVLSMLVFSFIDDGTGERLRTHPVPRERVINAIRANPEYAAAAGLTEEGVRAFYKKVDEKRGK